MNRVGFDMLIRAHRVRTEPGVHGGGGWGARSRLGSWNTERDDGWARRGVGSDRRVRSVNQKLKVAWIETAVRIASGS